MALTRHSPLVVLLVVASIASMAVSRLYADDWPGFRGLDKQGRCDSAEMPLRWSPSSNIKWKTAIPGRGHSSPIVSGDRLYLTTAYKSNRLFPVEILWKYGIFTLALLFTVTGLTLAIENLQTARSPAHRAWQHARTFMFAVLLGGVAIVALFGRGLLDMDYRLIRAYVGSIVLVFCCIVLGLLFVRARSRWFLAAAVLSLLFTAPAVVAPKYRELSPDPASLEALALTVASFSPAILGLVLLAIHLLARRQRVESPQTSTDLAQRPGSIQPFLPTLAAGFIFAATPFFLLVFRAAGYGFSDAATWSNRVRPDVSWWSIALYAAATIAAILHACRGSARAAPPAKLPLQPLLFASGLALGSAFFAHTNFVKPPKQFLRAILCLSCHDGKLLWSCEGLASERKGRSSVVTYASATPVTDGERIYGYFGEDGLMCADRQGRILWKKTEPMFRGNFGVGTSPIIENEMLVILSDVAKSPKMASSITAYDGATGRPLWRKERPSHEKYAVYGTPVITAAGGKTLLIAHGWHDIRGYDPKTGAELWSYPIEHRGRHLVASLVSDSGRLFVTAAREITALDISKLGTNADPLLWISPVAGEKSSTPVLVDGLLFLVTEAGQAYCLDAGTGQVEWKKRLPGRYFSSLVAVGDKLLFTNEAGQTTVVAAERQFRQLATNDLSEPIYASPVPVGERLFIRTAKHLYCIEQN